MNVVDQTSQIQPEVVDRLRRKLNDLYGARLARVVLFGSRARGEAHADSDWDVAVFLTDLPDRWAEMDRLARLHLEMLYESDAFFDVHPFVTSDYEQRTPLMHELRRDGVDL